jgi:Domain of unknown function (DUF4268)
VRNANPNATFAHSSPLELWWDRLRQHAGSRYVNRNANKNWLWGHTDIPSLYYNYGATQDHCSAELFIHLTSQGGETRTAYIFDRLHAHRAEIEKSFGDRLIWDLMPGHPSRRIRCLSTAGGYQSPREHWPEIQAGIIAAMTRLEKALEPYLDEFR